MPKPHNIMIHNFDKSSEYYDGDGDQLLGFYYQFTDAADQPISDLIGPYGCTVTVERAAKRAFHSRDF